MQDEIIKAVIVDDDAGNLENLRILLDKYCGNVEVCAVATGVSDALQKMESVRPDLLFLDVELKGETGFDLLEKLERHDFQLIIVSAFDHYAINAFRFSAIDYLLKPVSINDLQKAVKRVEERRLDPSAFRALENLVANMTRKTGCPRIGLPMSQCIEFVEVNEIVRCLGESSYTTFFLRGGQKKLVSRTLKEFEELLAEHDFVRVHKSHLVNSRFVKSVVRSVDPYVVMQDDTAIPVSPLRRNKLMSVLTRKFHP